MPGQDLEQADVVRVELVASELRDHDQPDHGRSVQERHRDEGLLDLDGAGDVLTDAAVGCVTREEGLTCLRDVTRDTDADLGRQRLHGGVGCRGELASERDRSEIVAVPDKDAAVVVIDQLSQLVGDRRADLAHVDEAGELAGRSVQHLQVCDRAPVVVATRRGIRTLALILVEDDDPALPPCLGGHHGELRTRDELAWIGRVLGPERDSDR